MSQFTITRQQESELPYVLNVQFINVNTDYQKGSQQAMRMAVASSQKASVNAPIVFDDVTGRNIAEKLLYNVWVERDRFQFKLPGMYAYLEPTDVLTLREFTTGVEYVVRIAKMTEARNREIEVEAVADYSPVYQQNAVTTPATVTTQVYQASSDTVAVFFDIPALRYIDVSGGFYVAMCGQGAVWAGGVVYKSLDGGANYDPYLTSVTDAIIGTTTDVLGGTVSDWDSLDTTNTVTVTLYGNRTIESTTDIGLSGGANLAILESSEGWEIFQFKTATLTGTNTYQLSNLKRGLRYTRYAAYGHSIGNRFVLLEQNALLRATVPNDLIGASLTYKVLTAGQNLASGTVVPFTSVGEAMKYGSFATVVSATGFGGDVTIRMQPQFDTYDYILTPAQDIRTYAVEIWDSTFSSVKRTITVTGSDEFAPSPDFAPYDFKAVYTSANQVSDFGSVQTTMNIKIYGVSPIVGRNHATAYAVDSSGATLVSGSSGSGGGGGGVSGATLFVATTGSDSNSGTSYSTPFRTIQKAVDVATAGAIVSVAPGTYAETIFGTNDGTSSQPIKFVSSTQWGAKIVPPTANSSLDMAWQHQGDYVTIDGFEIDGTTDPTTGAVWRIGIRMTGTQAVATRNHVHHIGRNHDATSSGGAGILMDSAYGATGGTASRNLVHHIGPISGVGGNYVQGVYYTTVGGTIENNIVHNVTGWGIHGWHDVRNTKVNNNTSFANGQGGFIVGGGDYVNLSSPCNNMVFTNNIAYSNSGVGFRELGDNGSSNLWSNNLSNANTTNWALNTSPHVNDVAGSPLFVNYQADGSGDYHLSIASPAIGSGLATYAPSVDFIGTTRTSPYDLGAYKA
jgi:hypothetical protein